jgi:hypothetical protein
MKLTRREKRSRRAITILAFSRLANSRSVCRGGCQYRLRRHLRCWSGSRDSLGERGVCRIHRRLSGIRGLRKISWGDQDTVQRATAARQYGAQPPRCRKPPFDRRHHVRTAGLRGANLAAAKHLGPLSTSLTMISPHLRRPPQFGDVMMVAAGSTSDSSSLMIVAMKYPKPPKRPTDLEEAFRELKRLRIEVAKAEAAARKKRCSNGQMKTIGDRDDDNAP